MSQTCVQFFFVHNEVVISVCGNTLRVNSTSLRDHQSSCQAAASISSFSRALGLTAMSVEVRPPPSLCGVVVATKRAAFGVRERGATNAAGSFLLSSFERGEKKTYYALIKFLAPSSLWLCSSPFCLSLSLPRASACLSTL